jgi:hypothetical protein
MDPWFTCPTPQSNLLQHNQLPASGTSAYFKSKSNKLPSTYVTVQTKPEVLPDHVILYKEKVVGNLERENFIFPDGRINKTTSFIVLASAGTKFAVTTKLHTLGSPIMFVAFVQVKKSPGTMQSF